MSEAAGSTPATKRSLSRGQKPASNIQVAPLLLECADCEPEAVFARLQTSREGLSSVQAEERLTQHGPNVVAGENRHPRLRLFGHAVMNPLVILLLVLAAFSIITEDYRAATVMILMVILGVV